MTIDRYTNNLQRLDERSQFFSWDKVAYGVDIWKTTKFELDYK